MPPMKIPSQAARIEYLSVKLEAGKDGAFRYSWRWTVPYPNYRWQSQDFPTRAAAESAMKAFIAEQSKPYVRVIIESAA